MITIFFELSYLLKWLVHYIGVYCYHFDKNLHMVADQDLTLRSSFTQIDSVSNIIRMHKFFLEFDSFRLYLIQ